MKKQIHERISSDILKYDKADTIVTNSKIASFLLDSDIYTPLNTGEINPVGSISEPLCVGSLNEIMVYIDPHMNWNDDTVYVKKDEDLLAEIKFVITNEESV
jgi:Flp pilus assembly CpaF family ATPase